MNIENMTSKELKATAKELKVKNWWNLKKAELIAAIQSIQNDTEDVEETTSEESIVENEEAAQNDADTSKNNGWEEIAKENIKYAYEWIVGENENTLQDEDEDSDAYKASYNYLHSGNEIMEDIYHEAITTEYGPGYSGGKAPSEMRFAGKKFCKEYITELLKRDGYMKDEPAEEPAEEEKPAKKSRGKMIEYNGESKNLNQWAKELGMSGQTLFARIYISGWTVEKAFTTPTKARKKKTEEEA